MTRLGGNILTVVALTMMLAGPALACDVDFDCPHGSMILNGKSHPLVCGRLTGRGMTSSNIGSGTIGTLIKANGPWRPGLVAPGTPMITTDPLVCDNCYIHAVSDFSFSNGCLGVSRDAFNTLKSCSGSPFTVTAK